MIRCPLSFSPAAKPNLQVRAGAEGLPRTGQHDYFYAFVEVEHAKDAFQILCHGQCEGIVLVWTVQSDDHDWGYGRGAGWVVRHLNVGCLETFVRRWNGNWGGIGIHFGSIILMMQLSD